MDIGPFELLCGIAAVLLFFYYTCTPYYNFWKERGVKGPTPLPLFGTFKDVILQKRNMLEQIRIYYKQYPNERMIGLFSRNNPILLLKDPEVIQDVLIRDFSKWMARNRRIHEKTEPLSQHLVSLEPKRWRPLRIRLSPIFTSGKLKEMFPIIDECGDHLNNYLKSITALGEPIEVRELTAKFTTDVIGNCAFGLKMNALSDEKSEFREMGRKLFRITWWRMIKFTIREQFPTAYSYLGAIFRDTETTDFFVNCLKQTIEYREKNNIRRNDFVDNLRDLKNSTKKIGDMDITDTFLASQAFIFFVAGFETSSSTMSFMLYELAQNHDIQNKVRTEIMEVLKSNDGKLTYDGVKSMSYLHKVFQETLRKHPPAAQTSRRSVSEYTFAGTNITVPEDIAVVVPIYSIHHDPDIYPKPEVFDPERFSEENIKSRHPMFYLPFGNGPRNCIGARFATYQSKVGIIKILQNYSIDICEKTEIPYAIHPAASLLSPRNGIHLKLVEIK